VKRTESGQRKWLVDHAEEVLGAIGMGPGHTVLDFGCGEGIFALPSARVVGREGVVQALDCDEDKLVALAARAADAGLTNIRTVHTSDEIEVPLPDESCDAMLLYDVLHLINDWQALFAEAFRVLRPEGTLSVYPMHVDDQDVKRECTSQGLNFASAYQRVLNFVRPKAHGEGEEQR